VATIGRQLGISGPTRFVGRETELAVLTQALERVGAGHGQVVVIVGMALAECVGCDHGCVQVPERDIPLRWRLSGNRDHLRAEDLSLHGHGSPWLLQA
jgi:2-keto-3-deoxy-galactonokinase